MLRRTDGREPTGAIALAGGGRLESASLDEAFLGIEGMLSFAAEVAQGGGEDRLHLHFQVVAGEEERVARRALAALLHSERIAPLFKHRALALGSITFAGADAAAANGLGGEGAQAVVVPRPALEVE